MTTLFIALLSTDQLCILDINYGSKWFHHYSFCCIATNTPLSRLTVVWLWLPMCKLQTPGPCAYNLAEGTNSYKVKAPQYSISGRTYMPEDATVKPGPGAHSVADVSLNLSPTDIDCACHCWSFALSLRSCLWGKFTYKSSVGFYFAILSINSDLNNSIFRERINPAEIYSVLIIMYLGRFDMAFPRSSRFSRYFSAMVW